MNIGIDIRSLLTVPKTGIGEYTFELLQALFARDQQNQYALFYNAHTNIDRLLPPWERANVEIVGTHFPNKFLNASSAFFRAPQLDKLVIKKSHKALIHLDYWFSPNLNFTALSKNTKHILTIHDISFAFFPELYTAKQRLWHTLLKPKKQCANAAHIIVPSANTKQDIVDHYGIDPDKVTVIYPGLSPLFTSPAMGGSLPAPVVVKKYNLPTNYLLFLGSIEPRKNIIAVIEAFEQAAPKLPAPYTLVIAGAAGWNNSSIYARAAASPLHDRISFIGYVKPEEKYGLISGATIFIFPSLYEGFGFPVLEACAAGVPVITSNRSSLPEIMGGVATLIDPHRPEEIAVAIINLVRSPALRDEKIKKGRARAATFKWDTAADALLKLLQQ